MECYGTLTLSSLLLCRTTLRKNYKSINTFIAEPDSRAQCAALEDHVKEFGLTYFGMDDKRQGQSSSIWSGIVLRSSLQVSSI